MKKFNSLILLAIVSAACSSAALADSSVVFGGVDNAPDADTLYLGGVHAIDGNIDATGVLLRGMLVGGRYDYNTSAVPGRNVDADHYRIEAGAGYQWVMQQAKVAVYGGVDHQDHELSPNDRKNDVRGSETGGSARIEASSFNSKADWSVLTAYSTAFDTYWARGRAGYNFTSVTAGLEAATAGNEGYDEDRYGAYIKIPVLNKVTLDFSAGHSKSDGDNSRSDSSGGYVNLGFSTRF